MTAPTEDLIERCSNQAEVATQGMCSIAIHDLQERGLTDLPQRLQVMSATFTESATALRALQQEVERLRDALQYYAGGQVNPNEGPWGVNSNDFGDIARSALTRASTSSDCEPQQ